MIGVQNKDKSKVKRRCQSGQWMNYLRNHIPALSQTMQTSSKPKVSSGLTPLKYGPFDSRGFGTDVNQYKKD